MKSATGRLEAAVLASILVGSPSAALAAPSAAQQRDAPAAEADRRGEIEGLMEAYIISKLQDALELTDDQYARVVVAQKKLNEHRRAYRRERMQILGELRRAIRSGEEEERIDALLDRWWRLRREHFESETADYEAIDAVLTPRQRARYRILEVEIERRLSQLLREIRGRREAPPRRPERR